MRPGPSLQVWGLGLLSLSEGQLLSEPGGGGTAHPRGVWGVKGGGRQETRAVHGSTWVLQLRSDKFGLPPPSLLAFGGHCRSGGEDQV